MSLFEADVALDRANYVMKLLAPTIEKYEICGSLRRQQKLVHDVDIVVKPKDLKALKDQVGIMVFESPQDAMFGDKIVRFAIDTGDHTNRRIQIDLYIAETDSVFNVLKLIRTGSANHNKKLAILAKQKGGSLKVGGEGLVLPDGTYTDEEAILTKLLGHYVEPEKRN